MRDRGAANAVGKNGPEMAVGTCGAGGFRHVEPRRPPSWLWTLIRQALLGIARASAMRTIGMIMNGRSVSQPFDQSVPDQADEGSSIEQ